VAYPLPAEYQEVNAGGGGVIMLWG
jgi:hypothetical protein